MKFGSINRQSSKGAKPYFDLAFWIFGIGGGNTNSQLKRFHGGSWGTLSRYHYKYCSHLCKLWLGVNTQTVDRVSPTVWISTKKKSCDKIRKEKVYNWYAIIIGTYCFSIYRKFPNISPELIEIFRHILGGIYSGRAYIRRVFCVSICVFKTWNLLSYE